MPIPNHLWLRGQTISNGSCGYHAMAEAFVRVARYRPELLNSEIFNPHNPIFAPSYRYLQESLEVQGPLDQHLLQAILIGDERFNNGQHIAQIFAPFISMLAASHYAVAVLPWRAQYEALNAARQVNDDSALELARQSEESFSPFGREPRELEQAHYIEYLSFWINGFFEDENQLFAHMSAEPFMHDFLNSEQGRSRPGLGASFQQMIYHQGLTWDAYPTIIFLENLCRLLYRPIHIEPAQNGDPAPLPYYPVSVISEPYLSHEHHPQPHEIIASVYRCARGAHYEYAIPPAMVERFHDRVSSFTAGTAQRLPPKATPRPERARQNPKARRAQEIKALNMIRAQKYQQAQKIATPQAPPLSQPATCVQAKVAPASKDLTEQIKSLEQKLITADQKVRHYSGARNKSLGQMRLFTQAKQARDALKQQLQTLRAKENQTPKAVVFSPQAVALTVSNPNTIMALQAQAKALQQKKALTEEESLELGLLLSEIHQKEQEEQMRDALVQIDLSERNDSQDSLTQEEDFATQAQLLFNVVFPYKSGAQGDLYTFAAEQLEELFHYELEKKSRTPSPK